MSKPSSLWIGPHLYTVSYSEKQIDRLSNENKGVLLGHCDRQTLEIYVRPGVAKSVQKDTLVHETLHGIFDLNGLADEWGETTEEAVILRTAPVLFDVIQQNEPAIRWIGGW